MKKVLYTSIAAIALLFSSTIATAQNVGIGTTPDISARLDVSATNKGLLIPRVNLISTTDNSTIATPATSLLVYNTNTTVGTGYYYNSGSPASPVWTKLATGSGSSTGWALTGNGGTTDANFIGTTDNKFLRIRSNNARIGELSRLNLFLGDSAGIAVDTSFASDNIAIGNWALAYPDDPLGFPVAGVGNIAIGALALSWTALDQGSVGIGVFALEHNEDYDGESNANTAIGAFAGNSMGLGQVTDANYNTAIGSFADCYDEVNDDDVANSTAIGSGAFADQSNMVRIGDDNVLTIGGIQDWANLSDGRYKKDIQTETSGLNFIMALRAVNYRLDYSKLRNPVKSFARKTTRTLKNGTIVTDQNKFEDRFNKIGLSPKQKKIKDDGQLYNGFIAQEVEVAANKVGYKFSGIVKPKNPNGRYGLKYGTFVVPLVEAVQEQQKTIEAQNKKIDALTKRLEKLESKKK